MTDLGATPAHGRTETVAARTSPAPAPGDGVGQALRGAWRTCGGVAGILVTSAPTIVFVTASTLGGLTIAVAAGAVTAVVAFVYRVLRREALGSALAGLLIAAACALVAVLTGEARGFFLLPTVLPAVILLVCLGTVVARRPLTGLLLNGPAGGPPDWRHHRGLMRVYDMSTLAAVAVNTVNFALQALFYAADQTAVLAAAHIATGPIFAALVAVTVVAARRRLARDRAA